MLAETQQFEARSRRDDLNGRSEQKAHPQKQQQTN